MLGSSVTLDVSGVQTFNLAALGGADNVTVNDLAGTDVMDAGLKELANLKSLSRLTLCETKVTDAGVEELQKALKKCLIFHC